jgi:phosphoribosylanthranilate isomerase
MRSTHIPRIKVRCILSVEEARMAVEAGADAIGLVSAMPSGPGVIPEEPIAAIARDVRRSPVATFLLTSLQRVDDVVAQQRRCGTTAVQICDRLVDGSHAELRAGMPDVDIVQVIHVTGPESIEEAAAVAPHVDALLLDSGNQALATKELGGTGRKHDWHLSAEIRRSVKVPVYLAGGLRAENIEEALRRVQPWGVDLCSGVRTDGHLDPAKLRAFVRECRRPLDPGERQAG